MMLHLGRVSEQVPVGVLGGAIHERTARQYQNTDNQTTKGQRLKQKTRKVEKTTPMVKNKSYNKLNKLDFHQNPKVERRCIGKKDFALQV
jgi:hypothetical protein